MSESPTATGQTEAEAEAEPQPTASEDTESDTECPITREQQMVFGTDGEIKSDGDSVETSLEAFGADIGHNDGSTQVAKPKASQFGVDDRAETPSKRSGSDQRSLFADVEDDQQTLGGDAAATRCLFGDDSEEES
jgi:hypothetical protein